MGVQPLTPGYHKYFSAAMCPDDTCSSCLSTYTGCFYVSDPSTFYAPCSQPPGPPGYSETLYISGPYATNQECLDS